jgi:hypothetical protein
MLVGGTGEGGLGPGLTPALSVVGSNDGRGLSGGTDEVLATSLHDTGKGRAGNKGQKSNGVDHFEKLRSCLTNLKITSEDGMDEEKESSTGETRVYMPFAISHDGRTCHGRAQEKKGRPDPQCHHLRLNAGTVTAQRRMTKVRMQGHWMKIFSNDTLIWWTQMQT